MFKNEYQGGPTVEILSAQGKDPLNKWKVSGNPNFLKRQYDKDVKSNIYSFDGSTTTCKLQLPKDGSKNTLGLTQRYLTIQIYVPHGKDISVELIMTDSRNNKRRLLISTTVREIYITPLHAKLNLGMIKRQTWLNLCFDLASFIEDTFARQTFKTLDSISLSGTCKVRRIFTMRHQPPDTSDNDSNVVNINYSQIENIPPALQFASTIPYLTQVITVPKIKSYLHPNGSSQSDIKDTSGYWSSSSDDVGQSRLTARDQGQAVVAFGSTIRMEKGKRTPASSSSRERKDSASSFNGSGYSTNRSSINTKSGRKVRRPISARGDGHSTTKSPTVVNFDSTSINANVTQNEDKFKKPTEIPKKSRIPKISTDKKPKQDQSENAIDDIPVSLLNLVDDLEDTVDSNPYKNQDKYSPSPASIIDSDVFLFSSRPHSATSQRRNDSESSSTSFPDPRKNNVSMEKDFVKSDSSSDSESELQQRIFRNTPSPRMKNVTSPEQLKNKFSSPLRASNLHSSVKSPNKILDGTKYDSKKYKSRTPSKSLQPEVRHSSLPPHRALNKSVVSLRSSDATITASVETLKQNSVDISLNGTPIEEQDSFDSDKMSMSRTPEVINLHDSAIDENYLHINTSPHSQGNLSQRSVTMARKNLRELPMASSNHTSPRLPAVPEFAGYKMGDLTDSMEAAMLASMKREQEAEAHPREEEEAIRKSAHNYEDNLSGDESFDTSWSTWKQPPEMHSSAYRDEMEGSSPVPKISDTLLGLSLGKQNDNVWGNLSPPVVMPVDRERQEKESLSDIESTGDVFGLSDGSTVSGKSNSTTDDEDMLDLMFDPCLNCYFDPRTQRYYELKG